jgi:hypothetical protein
LIAAQEAFEEGDIKESELEEIKEEVITQVIETLTTEEVAQSDIDAAVAAVVEIQATVEAAAETETLEDLSAGDVVDTAVETLSESQDLTEAVTEDGGLFLQVGEADVVVRKCDNKDVKIKIQILANSADDVTALSAGKCE